jgi:AcrB/AcrD/AcrF family
MPSNLSEADLRNLLKQISDGKVTPFHGARASAGRMPIAKNVAQKWAACHRYPLTDGDDLARIAQFVVIKVDLVRRTSVIIQGFTQASVLVNSLKQYVTSRQGEHATPLLHAGRAGLSSRSRLDTHRRDDHSNTCAGLQWGLYWGLWERAPTNGRRCCSLRARQHHLARCAGGLSGRIGDAARNAILLINYYLHLERHEGESFGHELILRGTRERLVPILMTTFATTLALLPVVLAGDIPGLEMVYSMALVILGGLVTSTILNLFVIPALYLRFGTSPAPAMSSAQYARASRVAD